ncbi:hypothetical protein BFJ72_g6631 [Fusarium proliferatum]|uniref:DUF6603 domain-containing protein n=1 Tax=Gibberella intermedia TaxID=948311 RepID=A0A420TEC0_GIBIN|nr:hypothetical protein BFJ72_g6631 [Fusarium proliferatum]
MLDAKIAAVFKIQNGALSHIGVFADCKAQMPKSGATKLFASIELGITAVFDLVNGSMLVSGCLSPNSYVIDPLCRLTGGFAAGTWFDPSPYAGDWVFALGVYGTFTIKAPIKNVTVTFGDVNGQNVPGKVSLYTFRGMLQQDGQGAKEKLKISCRSGLSSKEDTTGDWAVRAGSFAFDVRSNMATTQAYLNGTAVGAANKVYAKPMQLTESSNGLKADLIIVVTDINNDDQCRSDVISGNLPPALWSPYDSTKDPSVSNADKSALLDGSSSTILSTYGLSVRTPRPHLSRDEIKPFKINNVIFPITLETGATSAPVPPCPVPPCPVQEGSWEGKEATGETVAQKRKNVRGIWGNENTKREAFANAWVGAMNWTEFTPVTQTPTPFIDGIDMLVRGTPLISWG